MKRNFIKLYFLLSFLENLIVIGIYLLNAQTQIFFELPSTSKQTALTIIIVSLIVTSIFIALASVFAFRNQKFIDRIMLLFKDQKLVIAMVFISLAIFVECVQDIGWVTTGFFKPHLVFVYFESYLYLLLPVLIWICLLSFQTMIMIILFRKQIDIECELERKKIIGIALIFSILFIFWMVVGSLDFGYIPGTTGSNLELRKQFGRFLPLTYPILGIQVSSIILLAILLTGILVIFKKKIPKVRSFLDHSLVISILIWAAAILAWNSVPIEQNYLVDIPEVPKGVIYPNSDAFYFAKEAQGFLLTGSFGDESTHVFYSLFLSGLMLLAGNSYPLLIVYQLIVVALTPVLLFHFTARLHNRFSAFIVSMLFIVRERNGMLLGTELAGPVNNVLLSENLALLGLIGFLYLIYLWIENPKDRAWFPAFAGGVMGISLLIRADYAAVLAAVAGVTLFLFWKNKKPWIMGMLSMFLVVGVIITPWMFRNWQRTGTFYLDKKNVMRERITAYVEEIFRGDDPGSQTPRDIETDKWKARKVVSVSYHFANNLYQSFFYLPNNFTPLFGVGGILVDSSVRLDTSRLSSLTEFEEEALNIYTRAVPYYWAEWDGNIQATSVIPVAITLIFSAVGLYHLSQNRFRSGLLLFSVLLAHSLIWAVPGFSGNRFVKSVDWIFLIFYGVGLLIVLESLFSVIGGSRFVNKLELIVPKESASSRIEYSTGIAQKLFVLLPLILIGLSPTFLESLVPSSDKMIEVGEIIGNELPEQVIYDSCGISYSQRQDLDIYSGIAGFPRYYAVGEILGNDRRRIAQNPTTSRIGFYLFGSENMGVVIEGVEPAEILSQGDEVLVLGKITNDLFISADCITLVRDLEEIRVITGKTSD